MQRDEEDLLWAAGLARSRREFRDVARHELTLSWSNFAAHFAVLKAESNALIEASCGVCEESRRLRLTSAAVRMTLTRRRRVDDKLRA